jgi:hypothetical protein
MRLVASPRGPRLPTRTELFTSRLSALLVSLIHIRHPSVAVFLLLTLVATDPVGTPIERDCLSSAKYRSNNAEKAKLCARLANFRARARKADITDPAEMESKVEELEAAWQAKHA